MFDAPQTPASGASDTNAAGGRRDKDALRRAQMELVAARERGEEGVLPAMIARYPQHAAALIDFNASLLATAAYADVMPTPEIAAIAEAAKRQAFTAVFGAPAASPVAASLKELRLVHKLTLKAVSDRLGLGIDVMHALEAGRIRAQSVPQRLLGTLGSMLDSSAEQLALVLGGQPAVNPAFRRDTSGGTKESATAEAAQLDFAEMIRLSTSMTSAQKASWLDDEPR